MSGRADDRAAGDRESLAELVALHAQLTDDGEWETRVDLYTEDGRFTSLDGILRSGRDELRQAFSSTAGAVRGKHMTANSVFDIDGDRASGRTDYAFFLVTAGGIVPASVGRYHDEFIRGPEGWRFRSRTIVPMSPPDA